jgi:hypothetical protein
MLSRCIDGVAFMYFGGVKSVSVLISL